MAEFVKRDDVLELCSDSYKLCSYIKDIPATDVVERKTGEWIEIRRNDVNPLTGKCGIYVGCSECGAPIPTGSYLDFIDESECKFCYSCGAKMIGGDENER